MRTELPADYGVRDRHAFGGDLDPADREAHNATGAPRETTSSSDSISVSLWESKSTWPGELALKANFG